MSQTMLNKFRTLYRKGALKLEQVQAMLDAGKIMQEEYDYIIAEEN